MKLTWIGHSCFTLEQDGYVIVTDPYADNYVPGYAPLSLCADQVVVSHDHTDHNAKEVVRIKKRGTSPFTLTTLDTYHDEVQGAKRGPNRMTIFDDGETKVAHLGDVGCALTPEQAEALSDLDALLIPVGGYYTIDGAQAADVVKRLQPRIVIPMHYRDDAKGFGLPEIGTVDDFTSRMGDVCVSGQSSLETSEKQPAQVMVLTPAGLSRA